MTVMTAQEMQQRVNMRPTLMVGLGGTGQKVLVQLKARFVRNYGDVPPAIEFLSFDTDQAAEKVQVDGMVVQLTEHTELINIGGIETASIIRNLDSHPAIGAWITEDKERIPTRAVVMGAQQVRPLGRLSFFWHVEDVAKRLASSVSRLTDLRLGSERRGINVFIVSSVCGGTGSGAVVDVAYLVRHVIERSGLRSSFCYVNGILALPSVFPNVPKLGIESNAYACLAELNYFMESGEWYCDYGNPRVTPVEFSGQRPFNICYLVDARNENGQGLAGLEEIAPMIAEALYLQISSQVGDRNMSAFDNVRVLAGRTLHREEGKYEPTAYSSLGTASLVFPAAKIIDLCAHRLGQELIQRDLLRAGPPPVRVEAAVNGFLQAHQLEIEALLQQIARDAKNNVMRVVLEPRALDRFKEADLFGATRAYVTRAESMVDDEYAQALQLNRKALTEQLGAALVAEADRLADDPTCGLTGAIAFLDRLDAALAKARLELDQSRAEMDARRDRAMAQTHQTQEAFAASFRAMPLGRGGKIREARNRHVAMWQNYLVARFEGQKRDEAIALLAGLSQGIQAKRAAMQGTLDRLQLIGAQFEAFVERYGGDRSRTDFVLAQDITTAADIERYYSEHYARLGLAPSAALLDSQGPLHGWADLTQEQLADRILSYTRTVFEDINDISVEQVILEKKDQVPPSKRLEDLIGRSVPFWMFRREGVLGQDWEGESIVVVGVADEERSIYKGALQQGQTLTSTFDPHEITVLQTKHGVPFFALTQYRDFRQAHDHVLRTALKPLYVFPEVRPGGEKAKQVFALGVAYGFIFKSGVHYFVIPDDPGHQPIQLSQGMSESLHMFRNSEDLIRHVERQVEDQISREGSQMAVETLDAFVHEPYVCELKGKTRTNIDRAAMARDTSAGRPGSVNYDLVMELRDAVKVYQKKVVRG